MKKGLLCILLILTAIAAVILIQVLIFSVPELTFADRQKYLDNFTWLNIIIYGLSGYCTCAATEEILVNTTKFGKFIRFWIMLGVLLLILLIMIESNICKYAVAVLTPAIYIWVRFVGV